MVVLPFTPGRTELDAHPQAGSTAARSLSVLVSLIADRLDLRSLEAKDRLAPAPLTLPVGKEGCAVLFRYGAVVTFGLTRVEHQSFLSGLKLLAAKPIADPETDEAEIRISPEDEERVEEGVIRLASLDMDRLQLVADVLAKSTVLSYYEMSVGEVFDQVDPLADDLLVRGRGASRRSGELLRHIGASILIQHKMVGRVEVEEKPEILWDRPELERLYARLLDEYEIRERHRALGRKLELVSDTAKTGLHLLQHNGTLRVEWYIVILILVEIVLIVYELVFKH